MHPARQRFPTRILPASMVERKADLQNVDYSRSLSTSLRLILFSAPPCLGKKYAPPAPPAAGPARACVPVRGVAVDASGADRRLGGGAHSAACDQGERRGVDRAAAASGHAGRVPRAGRAALAAQVPRSLDAGARLLAGLARGARARQGGEPWRHRLHLRPDAAEAAATRLVPPAVRARDGVAHLGARAGRPDQTPARDYLAHVLAQTREPHAAAARAHSSPHAGAGPRGVTGVSECRWP